jgi:hypothetical protein
LKGSEGNCKKLIKAARSTSLLYEKRPCLSPCLSA